MDTALREALDELKGEFEGQFKSIDSQRRAEIEKLGAETGETKQAFERVSDKLDEIEAAIVKMRVGRTDGGPSADEQRKAEHRAAFDAWVRKGERVLTDETIAKSLVVSDDTEGGFLAPVEFVSELLTGIVEVSPIRQIATVRQTMNRAVAYPKRTGRLAAAWTGESQTRTETTGTAFGRDEIPTHEMYAFVDISRADLADTSIDMEAYLRAEVMEAFAELEGEAFVVGNGVNKPKGFNIDSQIDTVASGAASTLTADGLVNLFYALKSPYANAGTWVMKRTTLRDVRKLVDQNDNYVWQPGIAGAAPATILDRPYLLAEDMPAVGAGNEPITFGDFRKGYTVVDRLDMSVVRDELTQAATGFVRFHWHRRVGGQVRVPEALVSQTVATS